MEANGPGMGPTKKFPISLIRIAAYELKDLGSHLFGLPTEVFVPNLQISLRAQGTSKALGALDNLPPHPHTASKFRGRNKGLFFPFANPPGDPPAILPWPCKTDLRPDLSPELDISKHGVRECLRIGAIQGVCHIPSIAKDVKELRVGEVACQGLSRKGSKGLLIDQNPLWWGSETSPPQVLPSFPAEEDLVKDLSMACPSVNQCPP